MAMNEKVLTFATLLPGLCKHNIIDDDINNASDKNCSVHHSVNEYFAAETIAASVSSFIVMRINKLIAFELM